MNESSAIPDLLNYHLSSLTRFMEDSFISDHFFLGKDSDEHEHEYDEEYDDESYIEDDEEWLSDFMEDPFYETRKHSDEEAAEILGSPSKGIKCDGENICGICLDSLEKCDGDIKQLPCKHIYHYSCILESTKTKNTCPTCRGEYDCREKDYCKKEEYLSYFDDYWEKEYGLYFPFDWMFKNTRPMFLFEEYDYEICERKPVPRSLPMLNLKIDFFEPQMGYNYEKYEICERKVVPPSVTWLNLDLDFFEPQKEYDYEKCEIWGRKPVPRFFFEPYLFQRQMAYDYEKYQIWGRSFFALFDEVVVEASGWLGKRRKNDGKKVYGEWHMKPLACKEIYDYKSILGSTKIKTMGDTTAGRKMMNNKLEHSLRIMGSY